MSFAPGLDLELTHGTVYSFRFGDITIQFHIAEFIDAKRVFIGEKHFSCINTSKDAKPFSSFKFYEGTFKAAESKLKARCKVLLDVGYTYEGKFVLPLLPHTMPKLDYNKVTLKKKTPAPIKKLVLKKLTGIKYSNTFLLPPKPHPKKKETFVEQSIPDIEFGNVYRCENSTTRNAFWEIWCEAKLVDDFDDVYEFRVKVRYGKIGDKSPKTKTLLDVDDEDVALMFMEDRIFSKFQREYVYVGFQNTTEYQNASPQAKPSEANKTIDTELFAASIHKRIIKV